MPIPSGVCVRSQSDGCIQSVWVKLILGGAPPHRYSFHPQMGTADLGRSLILQWECARRGEAPPDYLVLPWEASERLAADLNPHLLSMAVPTNDRWWTRFRVVPERNRMANLQSGKQLSSSMTKAG